MRSVSSHLHAALLCLLCPLVACNGSQPAANAVAVETPVVPAASAPGVVPPIPPDIRILVIGQSISSNCNEKVYGSSPNVFQIGLTGEVKTASDPFEWSDCKQGAMWMPLGKLLIDTGLASKVTFMPIGIGGTTVADWQEGGAAFPKLNTALNLITQRGIKFDYAFWHQGSSDFGTVPNVYETRLAAVIKFVARNIQVEKWLVAVHSRCSGKWDRDIEAAQLRVSAPAGDNIFRGPDNNSLDDTYRFDGCHLNARGQEAMAGLWLESIKHAK